MTNEEAIAKIKRKACFGGYNNKNLCQWADEGFGKCEECENYMAIKTLEQNVKLKKAIKKMDEWVHSGNRGNCDYFIVDQIEEIINRLKKDGMVSE